MISLPHNFIFGIAESDLQTVGSLFPQKREYAQKTMWENFSRKKGLDTPLYGSYKFENYKTDVQLLGKLGIKEYRTSISMSRTIDRNGRINKKALRWYRNYFELIRKQNIKIHACLYHWEAPETFFPNGILDKNFTDYYLKHIKIVLGHLSDLIDYYIPINELWCVCYLAYYVGIHAPGDKSIAKFFKAYLKAIDLQSKAIQTIKNTSVKNKIGIVNIHFPTYVTKLSEKYLRTRDLADNLTNYLYSDPFFLGEIDEAVVRKFRKFFPPDYQNIIRQAKLSQLIDYYGINYYNSQYVKPQNNDFGYEMEIPGEAMRNSLGWPISLSPYYPDGLTDLLLSLTNRYKGFNLKRLLVSENGTPLYTPFKTGQTPQDDFRIFFLSQHLKQIEQALKKGAKVDGYFLWTLLDNYEWQEGYKPESAFGLVAIDKKGKRVPKKSYYWYQKIIKQQNER
ncbi:family 1 glycosylhydrolase [Candidatus Microgenomates bacterium]|nr:family 1 glycosylhydrolase [Candidatus Microgenomates bacterium]